MTSRRIFANGKGLEVVARAFVAESERMRKLARSVELQVQTLRDGGWVSDAANRFYSEMDSVLPRMRRADHALEQSARAVEAIAQIFQQAEQEGSQLVRGQTLDLFTGAGGGIGGVAGLGGGGGSSGGVAGGAGVDPFKRISKGEFRNTFWEGEQSKSAGNAAWRESEAAKADKPPTWRDYVDAQGEIWKETFFEKSGAVLSGQVGNDTLGARLSLLGYEADGKGELVVGKDGLEGNLKGYVGVYALRGQGTFESNGIRGTIDGNVGAYAKGEAGIQINPFARDAKVKLKGEAFAGAEISGEIKTEGRFGSIALQGSGMAGAGAKGNLDIGFDDGKFRFEIGGKAAVGVGGGGGIKIEVNVVEVAKEGLAAADRLFAGLFK